MSRQHGNWSTPEFGVVKNAAERNNVDELQRVLTSGGDPNEVDGWGHRPLHLAANRSAVEAAIALLDAGAEVDVRDQHGRTPLMYAITSLGPSAELVALLRSKGADPQLTDHLGRTPRHWASISTTVDLLVDLPLPGPFPRHSAYGDDVLTPDELPFVVDAVRALVDHDRASLEPMGAYFDGNDPYMWLAPYGRWSGVTLRMPHGEPTAWDIGVYRYGDPEVIDLSVEMWTIEEGPSDLLLQMELEPGEGRGPVARFGNLLVP